MTTTHRNGNHTQPAPQRSAPPVTIPVRIADTLVHTDVLTDIEHRRRVRELRELAAAEGIVLPMPPEWIATLEAAGYVVDLTTGVWSKPQREWPGPALVAAGVYD